MQVHVRSIIFSRMKRRCEPGLLIFPIHLIFNFYQALGFLEIMSFRVFSWYICTKIFMLFHAKSKLADWYVVLRLHVSSIYINRKCCKFLCTWKGKFPVVAIATRESIVCWLLLIICMIFPLKFQYLDCRIASYRKYDKVFSVVILECLFCDFHL